MSVAEQIVDRLPELTENSRIRLLEYLEFLAYQQQKDSNTGLQIAKERSAAFDAGKTKPLTKKEFWDHLKQKLG